LGLDWGLGAGAGVEEVGCVGRGGGLSSLEEEPQRLPIVSVANEDMSRAGARG